MKSSPLYSKLVTILFEHPELAEWKSLLMTYCCDKKTDAQIRNRVMIFVTQKPQFAKIFEPILKGD
jgi:hypothetical protein